MFRRWELRECGDDRQSNRVRYQTPYSSPIVPEPAPFFVRDLGENVSHVIAWTLNGYANIDTCFEPTQYSAALADVSLQMKYSTSESSAPVCLACFVRRAIDTGAIKI